MELGYNYVELPTPKLSHIPMEFDRKASFQMGQLVPILVQDLVPGDRFHLQVSDIVRFAPLISPVYHRLDVKLRFFFVPNRLVWSHWEDFLLAHGSMSPCTFTPAQFYDVSNHWTPTTSGTLFDYFDFPTQVENDWFKTNTEPIDILPFRAYRMIWNEYFRAEQLQSELPIFKDNDILTAEESVTMRQCLRIGWEKDYFTTALPSPQLGAAVDIPIKLAPDGTFKLTPNYSVGQSFNTSDRLALGASAGDVIIRDSNNTSKGTTSYVKGIKSVGTIEELRTANHLQKWLEKGNLGTRYNEFILANFGVSVPDYRIDRPEYIGGSVHPVQIGRVLNTAAGSELSQPLGSYAGQAESTGKSDWIDYYAYEHGYVIGVVSVMPRSGYYQGIERKFIRRDIFDYYFPDFATLGDQEILDDEIYVRPGSDGKGTFGYVPRYAHYKYNSDKVNGDFRTILDYWHMARNFVGAPSLNAQFVEADPTDRIFSYVNGSECMAEFYFDLKMVRPMPIAVMPTLDD